VRPLSNASGAQAVKRAWKLASGTLAGTRTRHARIGIVRDKRMMTLRQGGGRDDDGWGWLALVAAGQHACRSQHHHVCMGWTKRLVRLLQDASRRKQRTHIMSDTGVQQNWRPIRPKVLKLVTGGRFIIADLKLPFHNLCRHTTSTTVTLTVLSCL